MNMDARPARDVNTTPVMPFTPEPRGWRLAADLWLLVAVGFGIVAVVIR